MRTRLPTLMSLRAFEAASRHLSFTQAAVELNLTPTAISHQIKNLEQLIGTRLFIRDNNNLSLTKAAKAFQDPVRASIITISSAIDRAAENSDDKTLTVQCLGTFAVKRLIPKAQEFKRRHPSIKLILRTMQTFEPKLHQEFDVAIWHGPGGWDGLSATKLEEEEVFPVCSPLLLEGRSPIESPEDLANLPVIRTQSLILRDEWPFWLDSVGARDLEFQNEIACDYLITSLQAAVDGLGVMIGRSGIVSKDLETGKLIEPFEVRRKSKFGYYLVVPSQSEDLEKVKLFRSWLLEEFGVTH